MIEVFISSLHNLTIFCQCCSWSKKVVTDLCTEKSINSFTIMIRTCCLPNSSQQHGSRCMWFLLPRKPVHSRLLLPCQDGRYYFRTRSVNYNSNWRMNTLEELQIQLVLKLGVYEIF